jgi:predicted phage terminase large subunit-like protein
VGNARVTPGLRTPIGAPRPRQTFGAEPMVLPDGRILPPEIELMRAAHTAGLPGMSLARFVSAGWHILEPSTPLEWSWHLDAVCAHVEALLLDRPGPCRSCGAAPPPRASGAIQSRCAGCGGEFTPCPQNLLINVPPGSMKSLIFSVFAPAWMWLHRPSWRAIYASGTPSVVTRDSLKCRNLIKSEWYQKTFQPKWKIRSDQDEKQHFANDAGGFRMGLGAGGSVTGERADFLGVDDPNGADEIHSKAHRTTVNENWWDAAFHNRVANPTSSKRGLIMQRLHEEDLAGHVLSKEKGKWGHLVIQMEYETDAETRPGDKPTWLGWTDPRTKDGEVLAPRFTPEFLAGERQTLGSSGFAGQMQQRPVNAEGNRFKREWWRFYTRRGAQTASPNRPKGCFMGAPRHLPRHFDEVLGSWDCTFKDSDGSDWVVGIVLGRVGADKYLLARKREHLGFTATKKAIKQQRTDYPECWEIIIEDKANGTAVIEELQREISGIIAVNPLGGKEARAAAIEPQVEAGNVFLDEDAEWLGEWVDEFAAFPRGKHDDQVDALSQALIKLEDGELAGTRALLGLGADGQPLDSGLLGRVGGD